MRALAAEDIRRARSTVNHLALRHRDLRDDIESAAYEGLCVAARDWKPAGMPWSQYSYLRIMGTAVDFLRSLTPDLNQFNAYRRATGQERSRPPAREAQCGESFWGSVRSSDDSPEGMAIAANSRRWLRRSLAAETELLEWFDGAELKTIARRRGVTESRICQITTAAIARAVKELRP